MNRPVDKSWAKIFQDYNIDEHDFNKSPFFITAEKIKIACQEFKKTGEKEPILLCKQDTREARPKVFIDNSLFLLPTNNGEYAIIKGEGYIDIPKINTEETIYNSQLDFSLDTSLVGKSEMQHLDFAYASSLIRTFVNDDTLVLTIRGRKYTPEFQFCVGKHTIATKSVQTEVDAGYEGKDKIVLVEAKNKNTQNTIIRQLFYPLKQWKLHTQKPVVTLFFEKNEDRYSLWQFTFKNSNDYNSIKLVKSGFFKIKSV